MGTVAHTSWLSQVLRLMPGRLHAALDSWSYRLALKRAAQRRLAGRQRTEPEVAATEYKLRPWRD